jgi:hypothetical protein
MPVTILVHIEVAAQILLVGTGGFALGYLLGVGFSSVLPGFSTPLFFAAVVALFLITALLVAWLLGSVRLHLKARYRRVYSAATIVVLAGFVLLLALQLLSQPALVAVATGLISSAFLELLLVLCTTAVILLVSLTLISARLSRTILIAENALYADLFPLRRLQY